ncbi:hypothetical protein [Virgibacillus sp.]
MERAAHPMMKVRVQMDAPVKPFDMMRKAK